MIRGLNAPSLTRRGRQQSQKCKNGPTLHPSIFLIAIIHPRMLELPIDDHVDRSSSHVYRTTGSAVLAIPGV